MNYIKSLCEILFLLIIVSCSTEKKNPNFSDLFPGVDTIKLINDSKSLKYIGIIEATDEDLPGDSVSLRIVGQNPENSEFVLVPYKNAKAKLYLVTHKLLRTGIYKCYIVAEDENNGISDTSIQSVNYTNTSLDQLIEGRIN